MSTVEIDIDIRERVLERVIKIVQEQVKLETKPQTRRDKPGDGTINIVGTTTLGQLGIGLKGGITLSYADLVGDIDVEWDIDFPAVNNPASLTINMIVDLILSIIAPDSVCPADNNYPQSPAAAQIAAAPETTPPPVIEPPCVTQTPVKKSDWRNHPPILTQRSSKPLAPVQLQAAFAAEPRPYRRIGLDAVLELAHQYKRSRSASQSSCQLLTRDQLRQLLAALVESITGERRITLHDSLSFLKLGLSRYEIAHNLINGAAALGANVNRIDYSQPLTVGALLDSFFENGSA